MPRPHIEIQEDTPPLWGGLRQCQRDPSFFLHRRSQFVVAVGASNSSPEMWSVPFQTSDSPTPELSPAPTYSQATRWGLRDMDGQSSTDSTTPKPTTNAGPPRDSPKEIFILPKHPPFRFSAGQLRLLPWQARPRGPWEMQNTGRAAICEIRAVSWRVPAFPAPDCNSMHRDITLPAGQAALPTLQTPRATRNNQMQVPRIVDKIPLSAGGRRSRRLPPSFNRPIARDATAVAGCHLGAAIR
jgi:hypothetical protein